MKTQIGLPVLFVKVEKHEPINAIPYFTREKYAAIIINLKDHPKVTTTLRIFRRDNNPESYIESNVQHKDFAKDNTDSYWNFLDED